MKYAQGRFCEKNTLCRVPCRLAAAQLQVVQPTSCQHSLPVEQLLGKPRAAFVRTLATGW